MSYDPAGYVPGGSSLRLARAIMAASRFGSTAPPATGTGAAPVPPRKPASAAMSLQDQAAQMAAQEFAAARVPIDQQAAASAASYDRHGQAIQGFAQALASILGGIQPVVDKGYSDASGRTALFAKGFSDGMKMKTGGAADETNSFLTNVVGAPAEQLISPDRATAGADVAYGLGGYIPASSLAREGAAYSAAAANLPGIAGLQGLQDFTSNTFAGDDAAKTFADKIAALAATRPKLVNDIYAQLADLQVKQRAQATNAQIAAANLGLSAGRLSEQGRHDKASEATAAAAAAARAAQSDRNYRLAVAQLGISAAAERRAEQKAANARTGLTPFQLTGLSKQAEQDAESFYYGVPATTRADGSVAKAGSPPRQYQAALKALIARYPGLGPKRAIKILDGLYQPGEGGRPALSAKQQSALDAALNPVDTLLSGLGGP